MCAIEWSGAQSPTTAITSAGASEPTINDFSLNTPAATNEVSIKQTKLNIFG